MFWMDMRPVADGTPHSRRPSNHARGGTRSRARRGTPPRPRCSGRIPSRSSNGPARAPRGCGSIRPGDGITASPTAGPPPDGAAHPCHHRSRMPAWRSSAHGSPLLKLDKTKLDASQQLVLEFASSGILGLFGKASSIFTTQGIESIKRLTLPETISHLINSLDGE